jgi:hypothetical protein
MVVRETLDVAHAAFTRGPECDGGAAAPGSAAVEPWSTTLRSHGASPPSPTHEKERHGDNAQRSELR